MGERRGRPDYGVDAPGLCRMFIAAGSCALALCVLAGLAAGRFPPWGALASGVLAIPAAYLLGMGAFMVFESKVTKPAERERLLDLIDWRGDEAVLDVGCGRGVMLVGAARRLTTGRAVGVDIWRVEDQSANAPHAPLENARREGVFDQVEVQTADMRHLPFADQSVDIVLSHWAVHNLEAAADRDRALGEMARVLKAGGRLILTDIAHRADYGVRLAALGLQDQRLVVSATKDALLKRLTFGRFQPATILARR